MKDVKFKIINHEQISLCQEKSKDGIYLKVKVIPKSSRNEIIGIVGDRIKVTVRAAPQNGEANKALEEVIATFFSVKIQNCSVVSWYKSSMKTVFIESEEVEDKIKKTFYSGK